MSALTALKIKLLQGFRAGILEIKKDDLTSQVLSAYWNANVSAIAPMGASLINPLGQFISSIGAIQDIDALDAARDDIVRMVDVSISGLSGAPVRPILEELIVKVKDAKLSTLLKEFNAIKDHQPNLAAIGLRTIICLIILEKAKLTRPAEALAKTTDLMLKPMLESAIKIKIFDEGETKLLKAFEQQGLKETFDNVVHKPGDNALIKSDDLSALVQNTLNKLLAATV